MSRWFRLYDDLVDDPKVQQLPAATFKGLVNLWCLASKNDGRLPVLSDIAFKLRMPLLRAQQLLDDLTKAGLIDSDVTLEEDVLRPHNWNGRQFKSDNVSERVKKHREKRRDAVPGNVAETLHVTPPEAEADTEAEQSRPRASAAKRTSKDYDEIESLCRQAAGLENAISPTLKVLSPILTLLDRGYSLETDILPVLRGKKAGKEVRSWSYFVAAIEEQFQSNNAIKQTPKTVAAPADRQVFVAVDTPEWEAWQKVKRTARYRSDEHKADGFVFPTRWPPGAEMRTQ